LHFAVWSAPHSASNLIAIVSTTTEEIRMALINRMSRLFTADVHAVLDRIEEPDVLLKHAIREMEEELARSEQRVKHLEHERTTLADRHRKVQAVLAELGEQLDVCFGNGNEDLARKVIKRKLETERLDKHVAERRAAVDKLLVERRATADEQREHLDVMRQKAELLADTPSGGDEWGKTELTVGADEVEVAFLREQHKRKPS
jgi:phage shock protein A